MTHKGRKLKFALGNIPIYQEDDAFFDLSDIYYYVMRMHWGLFILLSAAIYLLINAFFAAIYMLDLQGIDGIAKGTFWEAFIFSFQTSTTIGYGRLVPQSAFVHTVVVFDAFSGLFFVAITTGLAFSKFSRPSARVVFSDKALLTTYDGKPTFMFRVGNKRTSHIGDAKVRLSVLMKYVSQEGHEMRRITDLKLVRNHSPLFALTWTVMHTIDEESPLYGVTPESIREDQLLFTVTLDGIEQELQQNVHLIHFYAPEQVIEAKQFADIVRIKPDGSRILNYSHFHDVIP